MIHDDNRLVLAVVLVLACATHFPRQRAQNRTKPAASRQRLLRRASTYPAKNRRGVAKAVLVPPGFPGRAGRRRAALRSPVAMDFDEDGRLYVAEFPSTTSMPARSRTARGASGCWRTPTATACTTRAPIRRQRADRDGASSAGTAASMSASRARPALPQGHRRRRQGRRAAGRFHGVRQGPSPARGC